MAASVTVPVEPTAAMFDAALRVVDLPIATFGNVWASMLAARPDAATSTPSLPPINRVRRNPLFWTDSEVRDMVITLHRKVTVAQARDLVRDRFGAERTPSASALHRAWQRLDLNEGAR